MKVYELMNLLNICPAGDEVLVGGYMDFKELAKVEDRGLIKGQCLTVAKQRKRFFLTRALRIFVFERLVQR